MTTVAEFLDAEKIPYAVDGGTLLGIVRDGDLIPYDTDLDIALFDQEIDGLLASREKLADMGIACKVNRYRGKAHALSMRWRHRSNLTLHAHVFTRSPGGFFWCPQVVKYLKWPGAVSAVLAGRRHLKRTGELESAEASRLGDWKEKVWSRVVLPSFPLYTLGKLTLRAMGRVDRQSWVASLPGRALYTSFTWVVPTRYFEATKPAEWRGQCLRLPKEAQGYLAHKYGRDWRAKKPDWVYFLDDHTMFFGGPESVVPRLEDTGVPEP